MKRLWILLVLLLPWFARGSELAGLLRELADIAELPAKVEELKRSAALQPRAVQETLADRVARDGFVNVMDPAIPGANMDDRYANAVRWILENIGYAQYDNPHVGGPGPEYEGFRGVSQVVLPSVRFPPGHYDFRKTFWLHPGIGVEGSGHWATRFWFWPGAYDDDRSWWIEGKKNGNETLLPVMIAVPAPIRHENGQLWRPYQCSIRNVNCKFAVEPGCVGIGIFGTQTNLRIQDVHLITDKGRDVSVAINTVPSSTPRECPWGVVEPFADDNGVFVCQLLDADIDVMCEYWRCGPVVNGMGIRLVGRSYYTPQGFHIFGQGKNGRNEIQVDWIHNEHGLAGRAGQSLAGVVRPAVGPNAVRVISTSPVWSGLLVAPETRGMFKKGDPLW